MANWNSVLLAVPLSLTAVITVMWLPGDTVFGHAHCNVPWTVPSACACNTFVAGDRAPSLMQLVSVTAEPL
jgi:hypothetical protein